MHTDILYDWYKDSRKDGDVISKERFVNLTNWVYNETKNDPEFAWDKLSDLLYCLVYEFQTGKKFPSNSKRRNNTLSFSYRDKTLFRVCGLLSIVDDAGNFTANPEPFDKVLMEAGIAQGIFKKAV